MNRNHEKLLVATLCGMIVVGAAAFAVQPSMAAVPASAPLTFTAELDGSAGPSFTPDIGAVVPTAPVALDRCLDVAMSTAACLVDGELPADPGQASVLHSAEVRFY